MSRVQYIRKKKKEIIILVQYTVMSRVQYIWMKNIEKVTWVQYYEQGTVHMEEIEIKKDIGTR